jgi:hypothetical protein
VQIEVVALPGSTFDLAQWGEVIRFAQAMPAIF